MPLIETGAAGLCDRARHRSEVQLDAQLNPTRRRAAAEAGDLAEVRGVDVAHRAAELPTLACVAAVSWLARFLAGSKRHAESWISREPVMRSRFAFAVALVEGQTLHQAVEFGHAASACALTRLGARPSLPRRMEIHS